MDPNITISGPSSARQQNAIKMVFRCRDDDGPTLNAGLVGFFFCCCFLFFGFQGIRTSIARKSYTFVIFQGEGERDTPTRPVPDLKILHADLILDAMQSSHHLKS